MVCSKTSATCSQVTGLMVHVRLSRRPQQGARGLATLPILVGLSLSSKASQPATSASMITGGYTQAVSAASFLSTVYSTESSTARASLEAHGINRHALLSPPPPLVPPTTNMLVFQRTIRLAARWRSPPA